MIADVHILNAGFKYVQRDFLVRIARYSRLMTRALVIYQPFISGKRCASSASEISLFHIYIKLRQM